ncbi:AAA family ATPase [Roseibacillus persicicus]|uniref:AAA family ATPase n=1 Tax=Roseibacillus persicicus TaxID=454148 RepID=UPI00280C913C|nr:AAA family ATPase [Roseibacillus persicicus]MDQ8188757.1 AAA family ATPase [Roseibacillus persicicus]
MKLTLKAFRGVKTPLEIRFNTRNDLTVLYGENGCGKTTISDALEFVMDGTAGSLEEKSLDGKKRLDQLVNAGCKKAELSVSLHAGQSTRTATLGTKVQISGEIEHRLQVLSRKNITSLIEETPAKRFERIQEFVSIPALEREEGALSDLLRREKQSLQTQTSLVQQAEELLGELFQTHRDPDKHSERNDWITETLRESAETIAENYTILDNLKTEINRLRSDFKPLEDSYQKVADTKEAQEKSIEALTKLVADHSDDLAKTFEILVKAQSYLSSETSDNCPVCDSELGHDVLSSKVSEKLARLKNVQEQSKKTKAAKDAHTAALTAQTTLQSTYFEIIRSLKLHHQAAVESEQWNLPELIDPLTTPEKPEELTPDWFAHLKAQATDLRPLSEKVDQTHAALQLRQDVQRQLRSAIQRIKEAKKDAARNEFILHRGQSILDALRKARIHHANQTLKAISGDFAQLYQAIHPGERIEDIKLYLNPKQRASAKFDGKLFGKDEASPVALLSESHLDTLGLCLFLALEKRNQPEKTILFLDDAIASVDEAHMERLYQLLLDQAAHFHHVIITSHYQPLRFKFRWGILTQKQVSFLELGAWSLENGITLSKGPDSEIAFLRRYLEEAQDAQTIAAKSGVVLERILDFLTGIYQCRLPRTPGAEQRWTLDHYKNGLKTEKNLLTALRCEHLDETGNKVSEHELSTLLEDIFSRLQVRNAIGCHYKEMASHFDEIGEAMALGKATLALVEALCDEKDTLPDRKKNGCSWHNRGAKVTRRLYPLLKPE